MTMVRVVLALMVGLAGACAREQRTETATMLARGLTALALGNHASAEAFCRDAASVDQENVDAQECTLLAAIHQRHWAVAAEAAGALTRLLPADLWLAAVAAKVRLRHDPTLHLALTMNGPVMGWACLDNACAALPGSVEDGEMRLLATLLHVRAGELEDALELSAGAPPGSQLADIHLLLLVRTDDFAGLHAALAGLGCEAGNSSPVADRLREVFAPGLLAAAGCAPAELAEATSVVSGVADLNRALMAMQAGDYAAAAIWLERCMSTAPGADLPLVYATVNALLAQDDATARQLLLALPPDLPSGWREWLRKLPHRRLL